MEAISVQPLWVHRKWFGLVMYELIRKGETKYHEEETCTGNYYMGCLANVVLRISPIGISKWDIFIV